MYLAIEPENIDDVFNNHIIKSKNKFTSEDVNFEIESLRSDVKSFLNSKKE